MNDPRLAEIEFLAHLARQPGHDTVHLFSESQQLYYGLDVREFKQLVFDLLVSGFLNGSGTTMMGRPSGALSTSFARKAATEDIEQALSDLWAERPMRLVINHRGRVHLWRLRDELMRNRIREDFGVLWAKRHFIPDLTSAMAIRAPGAPFSLIYSDLDHLKSLNDTLGHGAGDETIRTYLRIVQEVLASRGEGYRLGGDEVGAMLPTCPYHEAMALAERIRSTVEAEFKALPKLTRKPTASLGVATFLSSVTVEAACAAADRLLYASKEAGRNRVTGAEEA